MLKDGQDLAVSTDSPAAIVAVNQFVDQSLGYGNQAEFLIHQALRADPTWGMSHAHAAAYYLSLETASHRQQALAYVQAACRFLPQANHREQLYIQAIAAWSKGDISQAIVYHEAIAEEYPQDLLSVQWGQYHYFYRGNQRALLAIAETVLPANGDNHYLLGMLAFGLEQCHYFGEAEALGRKAVSLNRQDPWAQHAVAHVMETQGRLEEGIEWMEGLADTWANCNSLIYTHNWWHVALFYLQKQDFDRVLSLYQTCIWGGANQASPKDQVGAISLLLRLELQTDGRRDLRIKGSLTEHLNQLWQNLVPHLQPRLHEHCLPFQDLHTVYALARAGETELLQNMLASMANHAQTVESSRQQVWQTIVLPAAQGLIAHAQADWSTAISYLKLVLPQLYQVGGSHAQHKLFSQIYLDAQLRSEGSERTSPCVSRGLLDLKRCAA